MALGRALSLPTPEAEDDVDLLARYRPFLQHSTVTESDWVSRLELDVVEQMVAADLAANGGERIKVLVLFGSMRSRWVEQPFVEPCLSIDARAGPTLACSHTSARAYCSAWAATSASSIRAVCR